MAKACVPCLGPKVKAAISSQIKGTAVQEILDAIPDCKEPTAIQMCGGKKGKGKRAPSAYNNYIGECMRAKHIKGFSNAAPAMRECALEWKNKKTKGG